MRVAHLLRKYDPREWGGTESAVKRLCEGLRHHQVSSVAWCPRLAEAAQEDPLAQGGTEVRRFRAFLPVWGLGAAEKRALIYQGGNLMSLDLPWALWREPDLSAIHAHCQNRIGGIGLAVARLRKIPFVVSIHGGVLDLPESVKKRLVAPLKGGVEWGKIFGAVLRSRRLLERADAIITCNKTEAKLLRERFPRQRVVVQPHGLAVGSYEPDQREAALRAFPEIAGRRVLLTVGRIDPVKNQKWVVEQAPALLRAFPDALLVLAGSLSESAESLRQLICGLHLEKSVLLTGGIAPGDARLVGLYQQAEVLVLPSVSETFALVILEAWAAGKPVISTRTSGALDLIDPGETGWLFDVGDRAAFFSAVSEALNHPEVAWRMGQEGRERVRARYDSTVLAGAVAKLYRDLAEEKI